MVDLASPGATAEQVQAMRSAVQLANSAKHRRFFPKEQHSKHEGEQEDTYEFESACGAEDTHEADSAAGFPEGNQQPHDDFLSCADPTEHHTLVVELDADELDTAESAYFPDPGVTEAEEAYCGTNDHQANNHTHCEPEQHILEGQLSEGRCQADIEAEEQVRKCASSWSATCHTSATSWSRRCRGRREHAHEVYLQCHTAYVGIETAREWIAHWRPLLQAAGHLHDQADHCMLETIIWYHSLRDSPGLGELVSELGLQLHPDLLAKIKSDSSCRALATEPKR